MPVVVPGTVPGPWGVDRNEAGKALALKEVVTKRRRACNVQRQVR